MHVLYIHKLFQEDGHIKTNNSCDDKSNRELTNSEPPIVKLKIILLGATGSGKSSAGNVLLHQNKYDIGFKTSCYAKSETKASLMKYVNISLETEKVINQYKVGIIDTPAKRDTELPAENFENEMKSAITLANSKPDALLFCIPANSISEYFTEDIADYETYLNGSFYNSTIIVFTRCDQFESENNKQFDGNRAMKQDSKLKNFTKHITLSNSLSKESKSKKNEEVIKHIIDMKTSNKKTE